MSSQPSYTALATPSIFFSELNAQDLQLIQNAFSSISEADDEPCISKEMFCYLLGEHLKKGSTSDYIELFDKIDISRNNFISWQQFSSHLLLDYYESDDRTKHTQVPQWDNIKLVNVPHKNFICAVLNNPNKIGNYVTVGKDGMICFINENLQVKRTCQIITNPDEIRAKDLWVTDACLLANFNKICCLTTSKEILIYDVTATSKFTCHYKLYGFKHVLVSVSYWFSDGENNNAALVFGDTGSSLHVLWFLNCQVNMFDRSLKTDNNQKICLEIHIEELINKQYPSVRYLSYQGKVSTWIRQVKYLPLLDCFLACTTNSKDSLVLAWLNKGRESFRITSFNITLGINAFDYHAKLNLIVTGCCNHHVCVWNPYVVSKPVGVLRGHVQPVVTVQFLKSRNQIVSMSKDKTLRIWDVQMQICLQRLPGLFQKTLTDSALKMTVNQNNISILTAINASLYSLQMKIENKKQIQSHSACVTDLVYNEKLGQIISVCEGSCISIWYFSTGQKVKTIMNAHDFSEITTVTLNYAQTRIITAGTDGLIKIWDSNGTCYHVLVVDDNKPCEITKVLILKRLIIAIGWSKVLCCFNVNEMNSYYVNPMPGEWKGKHKHYDDILAASFIEPRTLVTASFDGDIILWNTNTQNAMRKIITEPRKTINLPPIDPQKRFLTSHTQTRKSKREFNLRISRGKSHLSRGSQQNLFSRSSNGAPTSPIAKREIISITSLGVFPTRNSNISEVADIFTTHSDGLLKLWNSHTCENLVEFEVFTFSGSIVSAVDSRDHFLGLGAESGVCKFYEIQDFCNGNIEKQKKPCPHLNFSHFHHQESITCIKFVQTLDLLYILTTSSDYTIVLHCFDHLIGIFGQQEHWNLNDESFQFRDFWDSKTSETEVADDEVLDNNLLRAEIQTNVDNFSASHNDVLVVPSRAISIQQEDSWLSDSDGEIYDQNLMTKSTWDNTILGKSYEEERKKKRDRKQPYDLPEKPSQMLKCSYRNLVTSELNSESIAIQKPDFIHHPERYFIDRDDKKKVPVFRDTQNLNYKYDEASLFPKSILDLGLKLRTARSITQNVKPGQKHMALKQRKITRADLSFN